MPTSLVSADSLLAIDVGNINTRAVFFDVVDGHYRYLASGISRTTLNTPNRNIKEGIYAALNQLTDITGKVFVGENRQLIAPSRKDGTGVDTVVATISVGPPINIIAMGLLEDFSLHSAVKLANTTYSIVREKIGINDKRRMDEKISAIIQAKPDLVIIAGGTDGGASQSILKMLEIIGLANYLINKEQRPDILYVGNQALWGEVDKLLGNLGKVYYGPNIKPTLDEGTHFAAQKQIGEIFCKVKNRQIIGVDELDTWTNGNLEPTSIAFRRLIHALSKVYGSKRGVLGVDIGASAINITATFGDDITQFVSVENGMGEALKASLQKGSINDIIRWLMYDIPESYVREYIYTKLAYPGSVPATNEDLDIELAIARQQLRASIKLLQQSIHKKFIPSHDELLPFFEPIIVSGSVLSNSPELPWIVMTLLDGLQPTGITTLVLDKFQLTPCLGAAIKLNPLLVVQAIDHGALINLCVLISPICNFKYGTAILRVRINYDDGKETKLLVKQGAIEIIPLALGQVANLYLQPLHGCDIGMGMPGKGGSLRVLGGLAGIVIDARGRPLKQFQDRVKQKAWQARWFKKLEMRQS